MGCSEMKVPLISTTLDLTRRSGDMPAAVVAKN